MWSSIISLCGSLITRGISKMSNSSAIIIAVLGGIALLLGVLLYLSYSKIETLQAEIQIKQLAIEFQNKIVEENRVKNEELSKQIQNYSKQVKKDFAQVKQTTSESKKDLRHYEPQNQCESIVLELAKAYQK